MLNASSLIEVLALDAARRAAAFERLVELVSLARCRTTQMTWDNVRDDDVEAAFGDCLDEFIIEDLTLGHRMDEVYALCGGHLVGDDPTEEDHEPWLLALALDLGASVVSEDSVLSKLPAACATMGFPRLLLVEFLAAEGI